MANNYLLSFVVAAAFVSFALPTPATATAAAITTTATSATASTALRASSMPGQMTDMAHTHNYGNNVPAATRLQHDNRWLPLDEPSSGMLHRPLLRYVPRQDAAAVTGVGERRSYRGSATAAAAGLGAVLNGLTNLSGLGHISNGYASVAPSHTEALAAASSSKQEIPIHEAQHEDIGSANEYADAGYMPSGYAGSEQSSAGYHDTIYDYPAAAEYQGGWLAQQQQQLQLQQQQQHLQEQEQQHDGPQYAYDKISAGNFLNHFDQQQSSYRTLQHVEQQQHEQQQHQLQQQQHQHEQLEHSSYFAPAEAASAGGGPESVDYSEHNVNEEQANNFLADSIGHGHGAAHQSHHHVDIINYVPVKHVKKQHVPVEKPVKIPISHAVIIPIKKPVPIHIPITKQIQVAVEKELKVPVERIVPVPVEKHIPVPVEKRVPYTVIKYMPVKVPKPFPVKVPVFKTVLHKVKGWW